MHTPNEAPSPLPGPNIARAQDTASASARPSPLRPRLSLRIGVTGHRPGNARLAESDLPAIEAAILHLLKVVRRALDDVLVTSQDIFARAPPVIRLISPLAEGADQAAAKAALNAGAVLECPLPFLKGDYAGDFRAPKTRADLDRLLCAAASVLELPGQRSDADEAYETVGLVTLRRSDLVIAVWDGNLKDRPRGGTTDMVIRAFESGLPVLWIDPAERGLRLIDKQGVALGTTLFEIVAQGGKRIDDAGLHALVCEIVEPPSAEAALEGAVPAGPRKRLRAFLSEQERSAPLFWQAYPLLVRFLGNARGAPQFSPVRKPGPQAAPKVEVGYLDSARALIDARHRFADGLSVHLGQVYRSGYVMNYALAALAVFFALLGLVFHHELKPVYVYFELAIIAAIIAVTLIGNRLRWHDRWVDYRQLAEQLRHLRFLSFAGALAGALRARHVNEAAQPGPTWANWYWRATLRELPLLHGRVDQSFVSRLGSAVSEEIDEQARYHALNAHVLKHIHKALDHAGDILFRLTAAVCVLFAAGAALYTFVGEGERAVLEAVIVELARQEFGYDFGKNGLPDFVISWVSFLGGLLPAMGAALYGIRVQGDLKAQAGRSAAVAARLQSLIGELGGSFPDTFAKSVTIADATADIMTAELSDWSMIFRDKPLQLPV